MRAAEKLSAPKVAKLKKPGKYCDGRCLWLYVGETGGKSWVLRYMRDGVPREMGLGPFPTIGLAAARERATAGRRLILDGLDPLEVRKQQKAKRKIDAAKGITFADAATKYIGAHQTAWKNAIHRDQWRSTLATYAHPVIGALPVAAIDTALVMKVLEPIWTTRTETASRVRGRIEAVLAWSTARGFRQGDNPARWRGHLDQLLPAKTKVRKVRHHPAIPYAALPAFVADLRKHEGVSARALEFLIINASRTGEVTGARWDEVDNAQKIWTIPSDRMKAGRQHRVPLTERALEILERLHREGDFIFPGDKAKHPISNGAMSELLKGMVGNKFTVHGFRSAFRDWAAEQTNYPREIAEAVLAHVLQDKTEAAYQRGDLLEKRRRLMRDWARHCASAPQVQAATVTPIGRGRA